MSFVLYASNLIPLHKHKLCYSSISFIKFVWDNLQSYSYTYFVAFLVPYIVEKHFLEERCINRCSVFILCHLSVRFAFQFPLHGFAKKFSILDFLILLDGTLGFHHTIIGLNIHIITWEEKRCKGHPRFALICHCSVFNAVVLPITPNLQ